MVTENSLFQLVHHYHLEYDSDCFNKAIEMAENDLGEVLDDTREYPPFVHYLCLEHMDRNPRYKLGKTFSLMTDAEKTAVFNETIQALKRLIE